MKIKKRYICYLVVLVIGGLLNGCVDARAEKVYEKPDKLTIGMYFGYSVNDEMVNGIAAMRRSIVMFEELNDIEIEFVEFETKDEFEYAQQMNNMMTGDQPLDMLMIPNYKGSVQFQDLVNSEQIADMSSYITCEESLIEGIRSKYYFPCAMFTSGSLLDRATAEMLGYEGDDIIDSVEENKALYLEWLKYKRPKHDRNNYDMLVSFFYREMETYIDFDSKFNLNSEEAYELVLKYADYFSDSQYFDIEPNADHEDIMQTIYTPMRKIPWYLRSRKKEDDLLFVGSYNPFDMDDIAENIEDGRLICTNFDQIITAGIVVNERTAHKELIGEFLDAMYSWQLQYNVVASYSEVEHVAKAIFNEEALKDSWSDEIPYEPEYLQIRQDIYDRVNSGEMPLFRNHVYAESYFNKFMKELLLEVAFDEIDEGEELRNLLIRENNKLFMMVNE